jgi:hypothetical protein
MATALAPTAQPVALYRGATVRATHWHQLKRAIHRRADRIEGILVVLAMLSPHLIITVVGAG